MHSAFCFTPQGQSQIFGSDLTCFVRTLISVSDSRFFCNCNINCKSLGVKIVLDKLLRP